MTTALERSQHYRPLSHDALVAIVVELLDERDRLVASAENVGRTPPEAETWTPGTHPVVSAMDVVAHEANRRINADIASAARELVAAKRALESPVDPLAAQIRLDGALANLMELCEDE